jgi:hypothetical protein
VQCRTPRCLCRFFFVCLRFRLCLFFGFVLIFCLSKHILLLYFFQMQRSSYFTNVQLICITILRAQSKNKTKSQNKSPKYQHLLSYHSCLPQTRSLNSLCTFCFFFFFLLSLLLSLVVYFHCYPSFHFSPSMLTFPSVLLCLCCYLSRLCQLGNGPNTAATSTATTIK